MKKYDIQIIGLRFLVVLYFVFIFLSLVIIKQRVFLVYYSILIFIGKMLIGMIVFYVWLVCMSVDVVKVFLCVLEFSWVQVWGDENFIMDQCCLFGLLFFGFIIIFRIKVWRFFKETFFVVRI